MFINQEVLGSASKEGKTHLSACQAGGREFKSRRPRQ